MPRKYKYRAVCHKECYWLENLWKPGEIYEGEMPPGKHFSLEGEEPPEEKPIDPGVDPRPTKELKEKLSSAFNFKVPGSWSRKQIWYKLKDMEIAESKDELTNPSKGKQPKGK